MPDLQEPSRVLIGGMQTPEGLKAIQELVRAAWLCLALSVGDAVVSCSVWPAGSGRQTKGQEKRTVL